MTAVPRPRLPNVRSRFFEPTLVGPEGEAAGAGTSGSSGSDMQRRPPSWRRAGGREVAPPSGTLRRGPNDLIDGRGGRTPTGSHGPSGLPGRVPRLRPRGHQSAPPGEAPPVPGGAARARAPRRGDRPHEPAPRQSGARAPRPPEGDPRRGRRPSRAPGDRLDGTSQSGPARPHRGPAGEGTRRFTVPVPEGPRRPPDRACVPPRPRRAPVRVARAPGPRGAARRRLIRWT